MAKKNGGKADIVQAARFVYETGIHRHTPRSGFWFLGSGKQSVAEHLFHAAWIAYTLAHMTSGRVDPIRAAMMALTHDLGEGRTGDLNYVHQRYGRLSESIAFTDLANTIPFGEELMRLFAEEQARETPIAKLVKDADQLEFIASLREEEVKGNTKAGIWIKSAIQRLKTVEGKKLGKALLSVHPDDWWHDPSDPWFVSRSEKHRTFRPNRTKK